jgi:hypothetical protein
MKVPKVEGRVGERVRFDEGDDPRARGRIVAVEGGRATVEQDRAYAFLVEGAPLPQWTADLADLQPWVHELKTDPEPFARVIAGTKRYEVRRSDRDFRVGDLVLLCEHNRNAPPDVEPYSGREVLVRIADLLVGAPYLPNDLCAWGFDVVLADGATHAGESEGSSMIDRGARRVTYSEHGITLIAEERTDATWAFEVESRILPGRLFVVFPSRASASGAFRAIELVVGRIAGYTERTARALDHVRRYAMGHLPPRDLAALREIVEQVLGTGERGEVRTGDVYVGPDEPGKVRDFLRIVVNAGDVEDGGTAEVQEYVRAPWGPGWWSADSFERWRRIARAEGGK